MQKLLTHTASVYSLGDHLKSLLHIVITLVAIMVWLSCSANAQDIFTVEFNDTMSNRQTVYAYRGNSVLSDVHSTIKHTVTNVTISGSIYIGNNRVFNKTHLNLSGSTQISTNWGTWHVNISNEICAANYYCSSVRFVPNASRITSEATGSTITATLAATNSSTFQIRFSEIFFKLEDIDMQWRATSSGTETNRSNNFDAFEWHYASVKGYFANESEINFELWIKDGTEEIKKFPITKSEARDSWSGTEWFIRSAFGDWFIQSFSTCASADGQMCSQALFIPDRTALNRVYGKNVTMWLRWTKTVANQNKTEIIQFDLFGHPLSTLEWSTSGSGNLEARTQLEFDDVTGTGTVFKNKSSSITIDVTESVTQNAQSVDGAVGSAEMIGDYLATQFGTNFKYGTWFVESAHTTENDPHSNLYHVANLRFVFRPDSDEINRALNSGETATSTLKLNIHQGNNTSPIVQSNEITVTIFRQTVKPVLSFMSSNYRVPESASKVDITVNLDMSTNANVTFTYEIFSGTAIPTSDYTVPSELSGEIVLGSTDDMISIPIINDQDAEGNEIFVVRLTNLSGAVFTNGATSLDAVVTIEDDDAPELTITTTEFEPPEEIEGGEFTIGLELASTTDIKVTFDITLSGGTATNSIDYENPTSLSREIAIGNTTDSIMIPIKSDTLNEGNETFNFTISNLVGAILENNASTLVQEITIIDNEIPTVRFMQNNFRVVENVDSEKVDIIVNLSGATNKPVVVRYETEDGSATADTDYTGITNSDEAILTINPSESAGTISIAITNDTDAEGIEEFKVKLSHVTNAVFDESATELIAIVSIVDDDVPTVMITGSSFNVQEGEQASFQLTAIPESMITPQQPLQVKYYAVQRGNFILWRTNRIYSMKTNISTLSVKTFDDEIEENPGTITVTLVNTEKYISLEGSNSAIISITDNDAEKKEPQPQISVASSVVNALMGMLNNTPTSVESETPAPVNPNISTVSIDSIHSQVEEGDSVGFVINANGGSDTAATNIKMSVNPVGDFFEFNEPRQITRQVQGQGLVRVVFPTIDDTLAEADGRLEVSIIPDSSYRIAATKGSTTVIVSDAVDRQVRQDLLTASSQAFLPDVVGNMTVRTSENISQRVKQGFNNSNNISLSLGGQSSLRGLIEMSGEMTNKGSIDWREILGDSSFTMTLLSSEDFVAPTTIWGVGDNRGLSSSSSSQAWSGDVFTGQFGIDALISREIVTGLSASIVENEIELDSESTDRLGFALNSTTLTPYLGWNSPTQNAELQVIASYGIGEFSINQSNYDIEALASRSYSFALSGRKELYASESFLNGTTKLNIIGDSWFASNYIGGHAGVLTDLQTDAHYLRLRTEGTHQFSFVRGSSLTPLISVGIRDDRKDQLTNSGMELTSGFDFSDPIGLTLVGSGSMLYAGENSIQKMSVNGTLGYDYGNDTLGLTFAISPSWGQTLASVQNTLWSSEVLAIETKFLVNIPKARK